MTGYAERIADEAAHHYAELRQRRVPALPALVMTYVFHATLSKSVLLDDCFEDTIKAMLAPADERSES